MRTDLLQQSLEDLNGSTADIEASALISTDGLMIASALPHGMDEDRIGAMSAALLSLGERAARGETPPDDFQGGLAIYDVSDPAQPRLIANWNTTDKPGPSYARGVHRFDFDGRYAYVSPTWDGYLGNIVMILDLKDPAKPEEAGRWWMPGQWTAGGEKPTWEGSRQFSGSTTSLASRRSWMYPCILKAPPQRPREPARCEPR